MKLMAERTRKHINLSYQREILRNLPLCFNYYGLGNGGTLSQCVGVRWNGTKTERDHSMPEEMYLVDGNQLIWISFVWQRRASKVAIRFGSVHDRIKCEVRLDRRIWAPTIMDKYHVYLFRGNCITFSSFVGLNCMPIFTFSKLLIWCYNSSFRHLRDAASATMKNRGGSLNNRIDQIEIANFNPKKRDEKNQFHLNTISFLPQLSRSHTSHLHLMPLSIFDYISQCNTEND